MLCYDVLFNLIECYDMICIDMVSFAMLCFGNGLICFVLTNYVMLCNYMLSYAMQYYQSKNRTLKSFVGWIMINIFQSLIVNYSNK